jgi:glycosyltransferase involved in cell wall biosynthesis
MLTGRDIVFLSTQDWNGLWTRKQRFAQMFARNGNRVLYIETPVHLLGLDVLPQDPLRFFRFMKGCRRIEDNLHVATLPILLPFFQMAHSINAANQVLVASMLRGWMRDLGFKNPILWCYTPFSEPLLRRIPHAASVYECVDEFRSAKGFVRSEVVGAMEDTLLRSVDLTIVTQENLLPRRAALCKRTFCVPNAADTDLFVSVAKSNPAVPPVLEALPRPRIGFVGHIQYWIDFGLIQYLAQRRPEWSFAMIGPIGPLAKTGPVKGLANVHFLGRQPQNEIPLFLNGIDVCLNPYFTGELANNCSPLKLYEYLAAGKPIVSSEMPEARKFEGMVSVGGSYEEILKECERIVAALPEPASVIEGRIALSQLHSWRKRFEAVNALVEGLLRTSGD